VIPTDGARSATGAAAVRAPATGHVKATPDANATRSDYLPFHVPAIADEEIRAAVDTLRSGWLTTGVRTREFEESFRQAIGARHAIAVSSGTAALHLALEAIGVHDGDEVLVPTMTFAATAEVVIYCRARPVLVDCEPDTLNIDVDALERAITRRTRAVIPVHFAGQPCRMTRIQDVARTAGLRVVEDAAHALPAAYEGRPVGVIGDITCFSFYVTKPITTGEGGMITTADDDYAERMRILSLHGISKDAWKRYSADGSWYYEILAPGYKYNLTDLASAIGLEQLRKCQRFWEARARIAARYDEAFADLPEIRRPVCVPGVQHAWHLYVIQLETERLRITRDDFIEALKRRNIGTSVHFMPLHLHPYYRRTFGYRPEDFPRATAIFARNVSLPIFPSMTDRDIEDVIAAVRQTISRARR
jgi:dTDP-4-amino-4,6-dideoxygalactose transaminase